MRELKSLSFCHVCAGPFTTSDPATDDHVPPQACFAKADRNFPLILPAHFGCNSGRTATDESIGQVIGLKHKGMPQKHRNRLELVPMRSETTDNILMGLTNVNVHQEIWRWVKGFHAALYRTPLPTNIRHVAIEPPFPSAKLEGSTWVAEPVKPQHLKFIETLKLNRAAHNLDEIRSNNGQFRYDCVWDRLDGGDWICIFAIDIYGWHDLGDVLNFPSRGCCGCYRLPDGTAPIAASKGTQIIGSFSNTEPLNPFGS